jgi:solute carrier family 25 folate transporter 32
MRRIYRTEGVYGFYRGMVPSLFGVTHVAVQFPLYEHFKKLNRAFRERHSGRELMCER